MDSVILYVGLHCYNVLCFGYSEHLVGSRKHSIHNLFSTQTAYYDRTLHGRGVGIVAIIIYCEIKYCSFQAFYRNRLTICQDQMEYRSRD